MADPRAENCRAYWLDTQGRVAGVNLDYLARPDDKYECLNVTLIDEAAAAGQTVATISVLDRNNLPVETYVWLAWPWTGDSVIANRLLPGNPDRPYKHMITNGYRASAGEKGPLAIYVGDRGGAPNSDIIGGLGLPDNRHVCYSLVFRERGATLPEPEPEPGEPPASSKEVVAALTAIRDAILQVRPGQPTQNSGEAWSSYIKRLANWGALVKWPSDEHELFDAAAERGWRPVGNPVRYSFTFSGNDGPGALVISGWLLPAVGDRVNGVRQRFVVYNRDDMPGKIGTDALSW